VAKMVRLKPIILNEPQPGFYRTKDVRGGVWIAVKIEDHSPREDCPVCGAAGFEYTPGDPCGECNGTGSILVGDEEFKAWKGGREVNIDSVWPYAAAHPITEQEYDYLLGRQTYAEVRDPEAPEANPKEVVDILKAPVPFLEEDDE
jgi:hypothetical protein